MSWKDALADAWCDYGCPDNWDTLDKWQQLEYYRQWEQNFMEKGMAQVEAREDR